MIRRTKISKVGPPEVMQIVEAKLGVPGPGEALVRHTAIGLNFIDIYHRTGLYPLKLPSGLGIEGAGVVESIGPGVYEVSPGDRVAYGGGPVGAYSQARIMSAEHLIRLPDDIDDRHAAAMMIKGLTAQYLLRQTYLVRPSDRVLIHAAAGGVGLLLCQWAAHLGATVIGTVGNDEKAEVARAHGCHHTVVYTREDFVEKVRDLTGGIGVPVVYDSVGQATWAGSLECLSSRGLMVTYGNASGPVPPFEPGLLALKGSLFVTRPTLFSYASTREKLLAMAKDLFSVIRNGAVRVEIRQQFDLAEAAEAHRVLQSRKTIGSTILLP